MVKIIDQIVSDSIANQRTYGNSNPINTITVHQTGNTNKGADAQAHANIQTKLNPRQASWHYQVDDKHAIQSFKDTAQCWAAGDGRGPGNLRSIHIELCINSDGDYKKTIQNGAELVKHLMDKHNLSINQVKQHHDWSGKNCPAQIRAGKDGITWGDFVALVKDEKVLLAPKQAVKTSTVMTDSIVDWMNANKMDSSYPNRAKLAKQHGINNYSGTAEQNTQLLNKLRAGTPKQTAKKGNQTTTSVVDYLKSIGADSNFANRKKLADKHGIKNYTGTASQNSQLLKKLRG
ncbi:hypothetical protein CWR48_10630 [Oceanobacillus arenosus]|uniref:N-acetylmuramoyl-L-alanine amidase n=1 Tax=Oceanobacillus arenosus TaxID=1229153 RepID=A0A3D8PRY6_9BACI|nr:N-acetylmuramoyl-L-alanine amidase [Oceanobacillus arenosus]RDW18051.1 hypothetical protein CWR48_10630 [Oceanobacillus arenosus]